MKGLAKKAFAVGLGFVVGQYFGKAIATGIDSAAEYVLENTAKNGNKITMNVCKALNLDFTSDKKNQEQENKIIGFRNV